MRLSSQVFLMLIVAAALGCHTETIQNSSCVATGDHNVVTCNSFRSEFTEKLGDQLIQNMPVKKLVELRTIGGQKDQEIGSQVEQYLKRHGYGVQRARIGTLSPPPDQFITLQNGDSQYEVTVAPSAH